LPRDFRPSVFSSIYPPSEIATIGFRGVIETAESDFFCWSSPLTFTFSSNYKYVMFTYVIICFCYSVPLKELKADIRFRECFRGVTKDFPASMKPPNPLSRSHCNRGSSFRGLMETAEADHFKRISRISLRIRSHMRNGFS
jgi:hypothetical protein